MGKTKQGKCFVIEPLGLQMCRFDLNGSYNLQHCFLVSDMPSASASKAPSPAMDAIMEYGGVARKVLAIGTLAAIPIKTLMVVQNLQPSVMSALARIDAELKK